MEKFSTNAGDVNTVDRTDAQRAFRAIWYNCEFLRPEIETCIKALPWEHVGSGRWNYSGVNIDDIGRARDLRRRLLQSFTESIRVAPSSIVGPLELAMWAQFYLYLPFILFPPMDDYGLELLGIAPDERDQRLAVTKEEPGQLGTTGKILCPGDPKIFPRWQAKDAFHTVWTQCNSRFREDIEACLARRRDDPGAQTMDTEVETGRDIWEYFAPVTAPARRGILSAAKLAMSQQFLVHLPWRMFPALDDETIHVLGITEAERAERLAVSDEQITSFHGSATRLNEKEEAKTRRRQRRAVRKKVPFILIFFSGRPMEAPPLPPGWAYITETPPPAGQLDCLITAGTTDLTEALSLARPHMESFVTLAGPFTNAEQYQAWRDFNDYMNSSPHALLLQMFGEMHGEDGLPADENEEEEDVN